MRAPDEMPPAAELEMIQRSFATTSDRIRELDRKGYARARIADALGVKYQFVRNVLENDKQRPAARTPSQGAEPPVRIGNLFRLVVEPGGKVTLPQEVLTRFDLEEGRIVVADLESGAFALLSPAESARRAQALVSPWQEGQPLLSERLIEERRADARRESH